MYGFRKENKEKKTKQEEYRHEYFRRGCKDLLKNITRKKRGDDEEEERPVRPQMKNKDFDESVFIKSEIIRDHDDVSHRVKNLLKSYDELSSEKDNIGSTIDRVKKDIDDMKNEFSTKLEIMMQFLMKQHNAGPVFVKSAKTVSQQPSIVATKPQANKGYKIFDNSNNSNNNNILELLKFFQNRQSDISDPTMVNRYLSSRNW